MPEPTAAERIAVDLERIRRAWDALKEAGWTDGMIQLEIERELGGD